jgi:hypothetical protein
MIEIGGADMMRVSGKTVYQSYANGLKKMYDDMERNAVDAIVIARLIKEGIEAKQPKTRYVGGAMAKPMLFMRKLLSDRLFDKMIMSQIR